MPCWCSTQGHQVQPALAQGDQQGFPKPAVWSVLLSERGLKVSHRTEPSAKPSPGHCPPVRRELSSVRDAAGMLCAVVTLLAMLSTEQGQPWQPAATSRSTQQQ